VSAPYDLTGSRILITGAAGGIGSATARLCARLGAELILTDLRGAEELARSIRAEGGQAEATAANLAAPQAPAEVAAVAGRVDAAVLAAGAYQPQDWDGEGWDEVLDATLAINLAAPIRLARALVPAMIDRGRGRFVLLGSIVATTGGSLPDVGPHYAVSKGGLHTLVRWLAARFTHRGVLTNGVAPGLTGTGMIAGQVGLAEALERHPLRRAARPEEVAWPIAFLCSPGASFISGAVLDVNGGALMRP